MEMVNKLRLAMEGLERKDFYKYMAIVFGIIMVLIFLFVFWYYSKVGSLMLQIEDINDIREQKVRIILGKKDSVEKQREQVRAILAKEKGFRIADYFKKLVTRHNLSDNKIQEMPPIVGSSGTVYREVVLSAKFANMTMKQLTGFLEEIEKTERVYAKSLDIRRSKKTPKTIEVDITIATLQQPEIKAGK